MKNSHYSVVKRQPISLSPIEFIESGCFEGAGTYPLLIRPTSSYVDSCSWIQSNRDVLETELLQHGAILFRDFRINGVSAFQEFAAAVCPELFDEYGDLPRQAKGAKVYCATPYPADRMIFFHNESSHMHRWPRKIMFHCAISPEQGGETPLVDVRQVYKLLRPELRSQFEEKGLKYVRNFNEGLDVSWREFFRVREPHEAEKACQAAKLYYKWKTDGGLRTEKLSKAIATHPQMNESVFFNQILVHHIACLDAETRKNLLAVFPERDVPRNVYFGDGSRIDDAVIAEIQEIFRRLTVSFRWQEGDVLLVDNMLTAHARNPYRGAREILVAMGEMISDA